MALVTIRNGCSKEKASLSNIRQFGNKAGIEDLEDLADALSQGKVYAWETGWIGYKIIEKKYYNCFFVLSIFNESDQSSYIWAKQMGWFWKEIKRLAMKEKCSKIKFQTQREGVVSWAKRYGFKIKSVIMEIDL